MSIRFYVKSTLEKLCIKNSLTILLRKFREIITFSSYTVQIALYAIFTNFFFLMKEEFRNFQINKTFVKSIILVKIEFTEILLYIIIFRMQMELYF